MSWEDFRYLACLLTGVFFAIKLVFFSPVESAVPYDSSPVPVLPAKTFTPPEIILVEKAPLETSVALEDENKIREDIIIEIADSIGYDWRSAGGRMNYGCPARSSCHCSETSCKYGVVIGIEGRKRVDVWIFEHAFISENRLRYVVLHEIAHVWQVQMRGWRGGYGDFERWLPRGVDPMEATADCLAKVWGAQPPRYAYWNCPASAEDYMRMLYESSVN